MFGEVGEGLEECLAKINEVFVDKNFRPLIDVRINHTIVLDDPFEDPEGLKVRSRSPSPDPHSAQILELVPMKLLTMMTIWMIMKER